MRSLLPFVFAAGLVAADTPLITATMPDGQRLRERFAASIYGQLWNDPAFAPVREQAITAMDANAEELGFKPSELFTAFVGADFAILAINDAGEEPYPVLRFQFDLGPLSEPVFAAMQRDSRGAEAVDVPGADAAFKPQGKDGTPIIARFGTRIVGSNERDVALAATPIQGHESDWAMAIDTKRFFDHLGTILKDKELAQFVAMRPLLDTYLGPMTHEGRIVEAGMWERTHIDASCLWLVPVDRGQLDRFPATALNALAVGIEGGELWKFVQEVLAVAAQEEGTTVAELIAKADADLAEEGVPHGIADIVRSLSGTWAVSVTPSAPFPAASLTMPRSPVLDDLVGFALAQINLEPPAEGATIMVPLPNVPIPLVIARDARAWLLTSDSLFVNDWLAGTGGGFMGAPAAQVALERGGDGALVLGISDTVATLRTITPFIGLGLGQMPIEPEVKRAVTTLLQRAVQKAKSGFIVLKPEDEGITSEMQGLLTYSMNPAIIAAIAIPNMLESRITGNESAAATSLKAGIFPALIQYQAGAYADSDQDGIGEYGFPAEMCSDANPAKVELNLLFGDHWRDETPEANGYRYRIYLPAKEGGATTNRAEVDGNAAEQFFIAYAWPIDDDQGRRAFAIDHTGQVYTTFWHGGEPEWHEMCSDEAWGAEAIWEPYRR